MKANRTSGRYALWEILLIAQAIAVIIGVTVFVVDSLPGDQRDEKPPRSETPVIVLTQEADGSKVLQAARVEYALPKGIDGTPMALVRPLVVISQKHCRLITTKPASFKWPKV